jgi:hypothetical protein
MERDEGFSDGTRTTMKTSKFEKQCYAITDELGISDPVILHDEPKKNEVFEDDGYLHVRKRHVRAVFGANGGQDAPASERNELFQKILEKLGYKLTPKLLERVLDDSPDDEEDDDDYCSHCGRGGS